MPIQVPSEHRLERARGQPQPLPNGPWAFWTGSIESAIELWTDLLYRGPANASETGWTAEVYAARRYESMRRACEKSAEYDSWKAHVQFLGLDWNVTRCVHTTRAEAERYQQAYLSLLERNPLPRPRGRGGSGPCDPGPLWNQLMARWRLRDVIGVAHSAGAKDAAMQVQAAIQRLSELFRDEASTRPMAAPKLFALTASLE